MNQTSDRDKIPEPFKRLPCVCPQDGTPWLQGFASSNLGRGSRAVA